MTASERIRQARQRTQTTSEMRETQRWFSLYGGRETCARCGSGKALRAPYGGGYVDAGYCTCVSWDS